jgi:hypothetical protein
MNRLAELMKQLEQQRFYGTIEAKLEAGKVVLLRKTETIKPDDYRDNRGDRDANRLSF